MLDVEDNDKDFPLPQIIDRESMLDRVPIGIDGANRVSIRDFARPQTPRRVPNLGIDILGTTMFARTSNPEPKDNQEYIEADERVREESAVLYDLEHATPEDHDAIAVQRAVYKAAVESRREVLRRLTAAKNHA